MSYFQSMKIMGPYAYNAPVPGARRVRGLKNGAWIEAG